jgi:hypothetical protein
VEHRYPRAGAVQLRKQAGTGPEARRLGRDIAYYDLITRRLGRRRLLMLDHQVMGGGMYVRVRAGVMQSVAVNGTTHHRSRVKGSWDWSGSRYRHQHTRLEAPAQFSRDR